VARTTAAVVPPRSQPWCHLGVSAATAPAGLRPAVVNKVRTDIALRATKLNAQVQLTNLSPCTVERGDGGVRLFCFVFRLTSIPIR
jgi:hypothetical protein